MRCLVDMVEVQGAGFDYKKIKYLDYISKYFGKKKSL